MPDERPEPPVPLDLDLRHFPTMPLAVSRLRDSEIASMADGEAFRAAVLLWCVAWHQVPCSSLPNDDAVLARYAGFGRDLRGWKRVRDDALHGFELCSDGRLYHGVIAEYAIESAKKSVKQKARTKAATEARLAKQKSNQINETGPRHVPSNETRYDNVDDARNEASDESRYVHQGKGREEKGREERRVTTPSEHVAGPPAPLPERVPKASDPADQPWTDLGVEIAKLWEDHGMLPPEMFGWLQQWREAGYQPATIIGAMREQFNRYDQEARAKNKPVFRPRGIGPMREAIERAHGIASTKAPSKVDTVVPPERWRKRVQDYKQNGYWMHALGPAPGFSGCGAPREILVEFGYAKPLPATPA